MTDAGRGRLAQSKGRPVELLLLEALLARRAAGREASARRGQGRTRSCCSRLLLASTEAELRHPRHLAILGGIGGRGIYVLVSRLSPSAVKCTRCTVAV